MNIRNLIQGTRTEQIISELENVYARIETAQTEWKEHSPSQCIDGCGKCCLDFEPDVLECEALLLAVWLFENQPQTAEAILDGTFVPYRHDQNEHNGCFLFNPDSPYHCTVYEGRCLICRLFGYSADTDKNRKIRWRQCKFNPNPAEVISCGTKTVLEHRQYVQEELLALCGTLPPVMADFMAQAVAILPDNVETRPLREALPEALYKIKLIMRFQTPPEPNTPSPTTPLPLSA